MLCLDLELKSYKENNLTKMEIIRTIGVIKKVLAYGPLKKSEQKN